MTQVMTQPPLLLNRIDAAALLGISPSTFSAWVGAGILPGTLPGIKYWSRVQLERAAAGQSWVPPDTAAAAEVAKEDPWAEWKAEQERENKR